jgi:hypothetical protein
VIEKIVPLFEFFIAGVVLADKHLGPTVSLGVVYLEVLVIISGRDVDVLLKLQLLYLTP